MARRRRALCAGALPCQLHGSRQRHPQLLDRKRFRSRQCALSFKPTPCDADPTARWHSQKPDSSAQSTVAIACADSRPYDDTTPSPSSSQVTSYILDSLDRFSSRSGDAFFALAFCHLWPVTSQSYYGGGFTMPPNTVETPVLILSQKYDPVTPLASAKKALRNLGVSNARLVEQDGSGHCSISQASLCTAKIVSLLRCDHRTRTRSDRASAGSGVLCRWYCAGRQPHVLQGRPTTLPTIRIALHPIGRGPRAHAGVVECRRRCGSGWLLGT